MRSIAILLSIVGLLCLAPVPSQACLGLPNCLEELRVRSIACKDEPSLEPVTTSTCTGHQGWETPTTTIDVERYVEIVFDQDVAWRGSFNVTLYAGQFSGERVLAEEVQDLRDDLSRPLTLRNVPTHLFPLLAARCVSASDPASRVFTVFANADAHVDLRYLPATRVFRLRISPEGFVNPPHCV